MSSSQFDPGHAQAALISAITTVENRWGTPRMGQAIADLRGVLAQAKGVLCALEQEPPVGPDAVHHLLGLRFQVSYTQEELFQAAQAVHETFDPLAK